MVECIQTFGAELRLHRLGDPENLDRRKVPAGLAIAPDCAEPERRESNIASQLLSPSSVNSLLYCPAPSVENCEFLLIENAPAFARRMSVVFITPGASWTSTIGLSPNDGSS